MSGLADTKRYNRHLFICVGSTCGGSKGANEMFTMLKEKMREKGITDVLVTRSQCFGLCRASPNMVIYPEGVWYSGYRESDLDDIVEQHLVNGKVVHRLLDKRREMIRQL